MSKSKQQQDAANEKVVGMHAGSLDLLRMKYSSVAREFGEAAKIQGSRRGLELAPANVNDERGEKQIYDIA